MTFKLVSFNFIIIYSLFVLALPAEGINVISCLKNLAVAVFKDIKKDSIPQCFSLLYDSKRSKTIRTFAFVSAYSSVKSLLGLAIEEFKIRNGTYYPITEYDNKNHTHLQDMTRQMGLNPEHIYVHEAENYGAVRSFTQNILNIDSSHEHQDKTSPAYQFEITDEEHRYIVGHELAHIAHEHVLKSHAANFIAPWATHAVLVAIHTVAEIGLRALTNKFNVPTNCKSGQMLNLIGTCSHFLLRNPLMEFFFTNFFFNDRIIKYYSRSQEKEADIESVRTFHCAEHAITCLQKADSFLTRKCGDIRAVDDHPSCTERIAYLTPIAQAQREHPQFIQPPAGLSCVC